MKNKTTLNKIKRLVRQVLNEQEQEIDDEEMNNRIHFGIKEMRDDLTVKWLTHNPDWNWLLDENHFYKDAVIGWDYDSNRPIWYSGTWEEGIWKEGLWKGGTFEGEIWETGWFNGGIFAGRTWEKGYFLGGTFAGETWENGDFFGGTFAGKTWEKGIFNGGAFANDGVFAGGTWEDGIWNRGTWENGTWIKGKIFDYDYNLLKYVESDVNPNEYFKNKKQ
jgi:hypothetical protein